MKKITLILAALAVLAACNKEEVQNNLPQKEGFTMTCVFAENGPGGKAVGADGTFTWKEGEGIYVHDTRNVDEITLGETDIINAGKAAKITLTNSDVANSVNSGYEGYLFAFYPMSAIDKTKRSGTSNKYQMAVFNNPNSPIAAAYSNSTTFSFVNVCGAMKFSVDAGTDVDGYEIVSNSGQKFYSVIDVRWRPGKSAPEAYTYDGYTDKTASNLSGSFTPGTETFAWIPLGETFTGGITIYFTKAGERKFYVTSSSDLTITRGHISNFGNLTSKLKTYVAPTTHDSSIPVASATDLGASGTANSYIVDGSVAANAGKIFKFKAVKGNSSAVIGTVDGVEILWETWNNAETVTANSVVAAADYDLQEGEDPYIVFQMPATIHAGNALIAAKSGSTILWSWHIWVPETTLTTSTYGGISAEMMDRNLGALIVAPEATKDVKSYGMYYSWGRKDPFFPDKFTHSGTAISWTGAVMVTAEESKASPTVYVKTGDDSVKDWTSANDNSLWGTSKTEYDPCPPGYIVPTRNKTYSFWNGISSATGWEANTTQGWFKAGVAYDALNPGTTGYAVFPYTGYIDQGALEHESDRVYIWSSYASSSEGIAYQIYVNGSSASTAEQRKSRAGSVRCVVE